MSYQLLKCVYNFWDNLYVMNSNKNISKKIYLNQIKGKLPLIQDAMLLWNIYYDLRKVLEAELG